MFGRFKKNKNQPSDFQFTDSPNTPCFSCRHVVTEGHPILRVIHDHDGDWQFLCGQEHTEADAKIISLQNATELDTSVNELFEMSKGVVALRASKDDDWTPFKLNDN